MVYLLLILHVPAATSQLRGMDNYVVTQWGLEHGLPQSSVNDIIQTRDGFIWLSTYGGLVRFDGLSFTTFDRNSIPGLISDRITDLMEDPDGSLWMATEGGLSKYSGGQATTFRLPDIEHNYSPTAMKIDGHGNRWFVILGIYLYQNGDLHKIEPLTDGELLEEAIQDSNSVWLYWGNSIYRTHGSQILYHSTIGDIPDLIIRGIHEVTPGTDHLLIGTSQDGVLLYKNGSLTPFTSADGLASRYIRQFYNDRYKTLWIAGYDGVSIWNGNTFEVFPFTDIKRIQVTSILHDQEGNYWIGSAGNGMFRIRPTIISTISREDGFSVDIMLSLFRKSDGSALFATNCGGIYEWRNGELKPSPVNDFLPNLCIWSVFQDSKGYYWIGSRDLYRTESLDQPVYTFSEEDGYHGLDIFAIMEDRRGTIWIGSQAGLSQYTDGVFSNYTTREGLAGIDVRTLYEDSSGTMWIGTTTGLTTFRDGVFSAVKLLSSGNTDAVVEPYVRAIHEDADGVVWIGTYGHGIYRLAEGEPTNIRRENGLFDNIISHIVEDEHGYFWMGSNRGISRVRRSDLNEYASGSISSVHSYSYGSGDGMLSPETNGGFQPNVIRGEGGRLYFPTVRGVAVISTRDVQHNEIPPEVYLQRLEIDGLTHPLSAKVQIPYSTAIIELHYTALSYRDPDKIRFQYKLAGFQDTWYDAGNRRTATYSRLPAGTYQFQVRASNNDGVWNMEGASMEIVVFPPYWKTTWFRVLGVLILGLGLFFLYFTRIASLKQKSERQRRFTEQLLESRESERRRIAVELHDGLGQQILVIKHRAELARQMRSDEKGTDEQLLDIIQSSSNAIADVRSITHALRPVHLERFGLRDALQNLCEEIAEVSPIDWSAHIDMIDILIPSEKEIHFYRVIQEAISNVEKHSSATEASVMIVHRDKAIHATIWDNGRGFDPKSPEMQDGLGLIGIHERVSSLNGRVEIESSPGEGTTFRITVPTQEG